MNKRQFIKTLIKAIVLGVQRNGDRIFSVSQSTASCFVPVDTGNLKLSGVKQDLSDGYRIAYTAKSAKGYPYASIVERGIPHDIPITGDQIIHRKGYTDKKGNYHPPKDVIYQNKRLIFIRPRLDKFTFGKGQFVVISKIKARPGQFYLARAVKEGLPHLAEDMKFFLRQVQGVSIK